MQLRHASRDREPIVDRDRGRNPVLDRIIDQIAQAPLERPGATGDVKPAIAALSEVTAQCVACHSVYRLK
jgi:hypothetical protein